MKFFQANLHSCEIKGINQNIHIVRHNVNGKHKTKVWNIQKKNNKRRRISLKILQKMLN